MALVGGDRPDDEHSLDRRVRRRRPLDDRGLGGLLLRVTPSFALAFLAGLLSFFSPCVLPLVPSYVGFLTGLTLEELEIRRDEPQGVHQGGAAAKLELLGGEAGQEPDVARDEPQGAGREEAQPAREEGGGERGRHPQKQTAETTVVQRPSSPHSAVEVMFIVRTISPDKSHCSRRSSQALSVSNGTPSTVASIDAARSSAYSPDAISFCP